MTVTRSSAPAASEALSVPAGAPADRAMTYVDLGATVRRADEPGGDFGFRLLYETCFGLPEPLRAYDGSQPLHECRLEPPAFRVRFFVAGRTAYLLGSLLEPEQRCVDRVCRAVFRAFPRVLRLLVEVRGSDPLMGLTHRTLAEGGDYVVSVPPTAEEYVASLGKATRRNMRFYEAKFRRECPEGELKMVSGEALTANIVKRVVDWNVGRMRAKGIVSKYEKLPDLRGALTDFTVRQGQAAAVWCGTKLVSGVLGHREDGDCWLAISAYDTSYERFHLGLLTWYWAISECCGKAERVHLGAGTSTYKERLGAREVPAAAFAVYRSPLARYLVPGEVAVRLKTLVWSTAVGRQVLPRLGEARRLTLSHARRPRRAWASALPGRYSPVNNCCSHPSRVASLQSCAEWSRPCRGTSHSGSTKVRGT